MINIGILGFGVVGSGTAQVISRCNTRNTHRQNTDINLKYIFVRRDQPTNPYHHLMTQDFSPIESDPDLHILVETVGGTGVAYDMTKKALMAGKSVVTANKELVALHGTELLALAQQHHCNYLFEAAVGGGIPILRPLTTCLMGNEIQEITGILNGTTNFILTQMDTEKKSYAQALKEAQDLGYAEQDPSADVEGKDACRKITILGNIAFGGTIDPHAVPTEGITNIDQKDMELATLLQAQIKLVGRTFQNKEGKVFAYVAPHLLDIKHAFYNVNDAFNIIEAQGDSLGKAHFFGQGAGSLPTASAVVGDILDLATDLHRFRHNGWGKNPIPLGDITQEKITYYVRFQESNQSVSTHLRDKANLSQDSFDLIFPEKIKEMWGENATVCCFSHCSKQELHQLCQGLNLASCIPFLSAETSPE